MSFKRSMKNSKNRGRFVGLRSYGRGTNIGQNIDTYKFRLFSHPFVPKDDPFPFWGELHASALSMHPCCCASWSKVSSRRWMSWCFSREQWKKYLCSEEHSIPMHSGAEMQMSETHLPWATETASRSIQSLLWRPGEKRLTYRMRVQQRMNIATFRADKSRDQAGTHRRPTSGLGSYATWLSSMSCRRTIPILHFNEYAAPFVSGLL